MFPKGVMHFSQHQMFLNLEIGICLQQLEGITYNKMKLREVVLLYQGEADLWKNWP
jgi:hypothetical protein